MAVEKSRYPGGAKLVAVLALGLFSVSPVVAQTTWYVAMDGSDGNPGTLAAPFATLPHAISQADPGDTIALRNGRYEYDNEIRIDKDNLTIRSHDGEWAVVETPNDDSSVYTVFHFENDVNGGRIERLELIGGWYCGVMCDGLTTSGSQNITISECRIHDTGGDCIQVSSGSGNITIERCELYNTGVGPGNEDAHDAEGVDIENADNVIVRNCYVHDVLTTGMYTRGGSRHNIFEGNLIMNAGTNGIVSGGYVEPDTLYATEDHIIRNNIIINTGLNNTPQGQGSGHHGIEVTSTLRVKVVNNTVVNAGYDRAAPWGYPLVITDQTGTNNRDLTVKNNLFYQESGHGSDESLGGNQVLRFDVTVEGTTDIDYNLYYHEDGPAVFRAWDEDLGRSQLFADWQGRGYDLNGQADQDPDLAALDTISDMFDVHLSSSSIAREAGEDLTEWVDDDYDGDNRTAPFDVGADQFGGTALQVPPLPSIIGTGSGGTPEPPDTELPTTPQSLVGTDHTTTTVTLDWEASTDNRFVSGYRVYRDGGPTLVATVSSPGYTDSDLTPATAYSYQVSAVDAAPNESGLSNTVVVTTDEPGPGRTCGLGAIMLIACAPGLMMWKRRGKTI